MGGRYSSETTYSFVDKILNYLIHFRCKLMLFIPSHLKLCKQALHSKRRIHCQDLTIRTTHLLECFIVSWIVEYLAECEASTYHAKKHYTLVNCQDLTIEKDDTDTRCSWQYVNKQLHMQTSITLTSHLRQ